MREGGSEGERWREREREREREGGGGRDIADFTYDTSCGQF